jgi:hypothetical protein
MTLLELAFAVMHTSKKVQTLHPAANCSFCSTLSKNIMMQQKKRLLHTGWEGKLTLVVAEAAKLAACQQQECRFSFVGSSMWIPCATLA